MQVGFIYIILWYLIKVNVVVHRLGFCTQSKCLGEGCYPYINIEVHCEINVLVFFGMPGTACVWLFLHVVVRLPCTWHGFSGYSSEVVCLIAVTELGRLASRVWIASWVRSWLEYTDVSVGLLLGQPRGIIPSPTPLLRVCALIYYNFGSKVQNAYENSHLSLFF